MKPRYTYTGGRGQWFITAVMLPGSVFCAGVTVLMLQKEKMSLGLIALAGFMLASAAVGLWMSLAHPFLRKLVIDDGGTFRLSYFYLWKRLQWAGIASDITEVVLVEVDTGECTVHALGLKLKDGSAVDLVQCASEQSGLRHVREIYSALGICDGPKVPSTFNN